MSPTEISCTITITDKERQILSTALQLLPDAVQFSAEEFEALLRKLEMAAAVTLPPVAGEGPPPICCPYCRGKALFHDVAKWSSCPEGAPEFGVVLVEFQCAGSCEGRSFWAGLDKPILTASQQKGKQ